MLGKQLWRCRRHPVNDGANCLSCLSAMRYNLHRAFCACGAVATSYRTMAAADPVEYFCDEHFQDMPAVRQTER